MLRRIKHVRRRPTIFMFTTVRRIAPCRGARGRDARRIDLAGRNERGARQPNYFQFLGRWLTNESLPLRLDDDEVARAAAVVEKYLPAQP